MNEITSETTPQKEFVMSRKDVGASLLSNHFVVYQERSVAGQLYFKANKQTHRKRDHIRGYQRYWYREGELDEGSQKAKLPVIR